MKIPRSKTFLVGSALDFNFERAVGFRASRQVESEKSECNNLGYKLTGLTWWP